MRRLVQVHEIHVDGIPRQIAVELGVKMRQRLRSAVRPAIHIFAGEKVCIQATRPTQFGAAPLARQTAVMASGVVATGLKTILTGISRIIQEAGYLACVLGDLLQSDAPRSVHLLLAQFVLVRCCSRTVNQAG